MHLRTIRSSFLFAPCDLEEGRCRALRRASRGEHECRRPTWAVATAVGLTSFLGTRGALWPELCSSRPSAAVGCPPLPPSALVFPRLRLSHVPRRPITVGTMGGRDEMRRFASLGGSPVPVFRRATAAGPHGRGPERLSRRRTSSVMSEPRSLWREGRPTIQGNAFRPEPHSAPRVCTRAGRDLRSVRCTLGSPSEVEGVVTDAVGRWGDMPATITLRPGAVSR